MITKLNWNTPSLLSKDPEPVIVIQGVRIKKCLSTMYAYTPEAIDGWLPDPGPAEVIPGERKDRLFGFQMKSLEDYPKDNRRLIVFHKSGGISTGYANRFRGDKLKGWTDWVETCANCGYVHEWKYTSDYE